MTVMEVPAKDTPTITATTQARAVLLSEWTKLRSVRSSVWALIATTGITVGLSVLLCWAYVNRHAHLSPIEQLAFDPTGRSLRGIFLAQLAVGVLGVLLMSSEYTTGLIRTTFAAVPQRRLVLAAKTAVFGGVALVVGEVSSFAAYFAGQAVLSSKGLNSTLGQPEVLRSVLGGGFYLACIGLLGLGVGTIIRRTAGAIGVLFGLVLVLPIIVAGLPSPWSSDVAKFLPANAGEALFTVIHDSDVLSAGAGLLVILAWVGATLALAAVLTRRDV